MAAIFANKSCELSQGCSSPRETSSCSRNQSSFGKHSRVDSRKGHNNLKREACKAILGGLGSSHSLKKLERTRSFLWDNHAGYGSLAQELGITAARVSELETERESFRGRGLITQGDSSCSIASFSRVRAGNSSTVFRKSKSFDTVPKGNRQYRVAPICGVENGVASEVLEAPSTHIPTHTPGAVILPSASYIESLSLNRAKQGSKNSKETRTLTSLKESVSGLEELTEVSPFKPGHLVECFEVEGGRRLSGEVEISGAKNSALAVLAGAVCSEGQVHLEMIPDLHDIRRMFQVLQSVGVKVQRTSSGFMIDARDLTSVEPCPEAVRKLRASFFVIGSLLGRKGEAVVPLPGGCDIGARPIDLHVRGLEALGAEVDIRYIPPSFCCVVVIVGLGTATSVSL